MTRFFVKPDRTGAKVELERVFEQFGYNWKFNSPGMVSSEIDSSNHWKVSKRTFMSLDMKV
jgi:hypothetical protein